MPQHFDRMWMTVRLILNHRSIFVIKLIE